MLQKRSSLQPALLITHRFVRRPRVSLLVHLTSSQLSQRCSYVTVPAVCNALSIHLCSLSLGHGQFRTIENTSLNPPTPLRTFKQHTYVFIYLLKLESPLKVHQSTRAENFKLENILDPRGRERCLRQASNLTSVSCDLDLWPVTCDRLSPKVDYFMRRVQSLMLILGRVGLGHFTCGSGWVGSRKFDPRPNCGTWPLFHFFYHVNHRNNVDRQVVVCDDWAYALIASFAKFGAKCRCCANEKKQQLSLCDRSMFNVLRTQMNGLWIEARVYRCRLDNGNKHWKKMTVDLLCYVWLLCMKSLHDFVQRRVYLLCWFSTDDRFCGGDVRLWRLRQPCSLSDNVRSLSGK